MAFNADLEVYKNGDAVAVYYEEPGKFTTRYNGIVCNNRIAKDGCRILTIRKTTVVDGMFVDQFNSFRADRILMVQTAF
jgi:hypothetical protein